MKSLAFLFFGVLYLLHGALALAQEPILVIDPQGHSAQIWEVLFTPDGQTLISVSNDKTIRLWDVATGDLLRTLRGQIGDGSEGKLFAAALSPDGKVLAVGGYTKENEIRLINLDSGEQIGLLKGHTSVIHTLAFSRDGRFLASGSDDKTVRIWEASNLGRIANAPRQAIANLEGHTNFVYGVAFSPEGNKLVSASYDNTLRLWDIANVGIGRDVPPPMVMRQHTAEVGCVAYSPDGNYIVSGGKDDRILLWDTNGKFIKEIGKQDIGSLSFSLDSKKIVVVGETDDPATVYSIPYGAKISTFSRHNNTVVASAFYGTDLVATAGGDDNDIYIWQASTDTVKTHIVGKGRGVFAIAFGNDSNLAFGNINQNAIANAKSPLEKSFNFADFSLSRQTPSESAFRRTQTEYGSKRLEKVSDLELRIADGGTIKFDDYAYEKIRCYTFTGNGQIVVGGSYYLKLFDNSGAFMRKLVGHTGVVWAVSVSQDGRLLASASYDQTIKLWNIASGELLVTLFVAIDNEWVCWTPAGYYAASAGGEKYIGWHLNQGLDKAARYYPVSSFKQQYYKPELVKRPIALGNFAQALAEINAKERQKIAVQAVTEVLPPQVQWLSPSAYRSENSSNMVQLKAKLTSDTKITEVRWLLNGRPFATKRAENFASTTSPALGQVIEQEATLTAGENEFAIFAANANASATSDKRVIIYKAPSQRNISPAAPATINDWEKPNLYMVSVGISAYQLRALSLTYADDDARAMSRIFQAQQGKLYRSVNIKPLYDLEATRANILEALDWLEKSTTQKDVAVIFLAAHGVNDNKGNFYVLPSDGNPDKLRVTSIDLGDFKKTLGDLPSRVLLFLDTCHSGQLGRNLYAIRGVDNTEALRELSSDEYGVIIMAASTGKESSLERAEWKHGAFTRALIDGLEKGMADFSRDGIVHLHELDSFVTDEVKKLTGGLQHPTTQKPSTISRFPIFQLK